MVGPTYGIKCVGRIVTKSMPKICNFWLLIVGDCDNAESQGWFLFGGFQGGTVRHTTVTQMEKIRHGFGHYSSYTFYPIYK